MSPAPRAAPPVAIISLSQRGHGIRAIAGLLGISRNAVRRSLREHARGVSAETSPSTTRQSKLDSHREKIAALLEKHPRLTAERVLEEIRKDGYAGSKTILKDLVRKIRPKPRLEAYDRIETDAGIEAQVDWSPMPVKIEGEVETMRALAVTLCHSRVLFVAFFRREDLSSLLAGLVRALTAFGGSPVKLVFDNPPSIVAVRLGPIYRFQERLLALTRHYGITPVAARVRHPRDKAKVERPFQDIERAFLYARSFQSLTHLNAEAERWLETWNRRIHGTTGECPVDRLEEERKHLLPLPARAFDVRVNLPVLVALDFTVAFDGVRYSVPPRLVGQRVLVRADEAKVEILAGEQVVACHERSGRKGARIVLEAHKAELRAMRREARREALERREGGEPDPDGYDRASREILSYGNEGEQYLAALVATYRGAARHELRRTLEVRDRLGAEAFRLALARAAAYGAAGANVIERIASDLIRRGDVKRPFDAPVPPSVPSTVVGPEVPIRPLAYYQQILEDEARTAPSNDTTDLGPEREEAPK